MKLLRATILLIVLINCRAAFAQNNPSGVTDPLVKQFEYYSAKKQQGVLFAHFDKTIYTSNEYIWFAAYLLNDSTTKNKVLSVMMVNDNNRSIVLKDKFKMDKGISAGNVFLPDTVPPGNYSIMLYTNSLLNGQPENVFIQPVTIKATSSSTAYKATLLLQDTAKGAPVTGRKVLLVTQPSGSKMISGATVNYFLGDKLNPVLTGTVKTDDAGQYLFTIPTTDITLGANILQAQISYGNEVKTVRLTLPVQNTLPEVKFYPEGGNLSDGITSVVGWEVKNADGLHYAAKGILYKDDKPIDTLTANEYGMGSFRLLPQQESRYYVKLLAQNGSPVYNLPKVLNNWPVVTIAHSIVNDTLILVLKNKLPAKFNVLVHNYQQVFSSLAVQAGANGKTIKIGLANLPKGLAEVTILDSLQQPYAERLFFAHYDQHNTLNVATDNAQYKPRQKVNLKLNLSGADGKPLDGVVSIACVQANRLDASKTTDIESYLYLNSELGMFPVKQNYWGGSAADKAFLENMLLVKGWRRYTWNDLVQTTAKDTAQSDEQLIFNGTITHLNKALKKPVSYILTRDSSRSTLVSQANGNFTLANTNLFVTENEKIHLFVPGNDKDDYYFDLADPYVKVNKLLAAQYDLPGYSYVLLNDQKDNQESLKGFEHTIMLKEVKIRGANDSLMNACGDYFCINGILNCPNHHHDPQNKIPVKGVTYYIFNPLTETKKPFVYRGCDPDEDDAAKGFNGVHYAMEFYPADYSKENPTEPDYLSTIYWNQQYKVTPGNEVPIEFYTSDITGAYKIIVQGVTAKGVVYGEKSFTVNKND